MIYICTKIISYINRSWPLFWFFTIVDDGNGTLSGQICRLDTAPSFDWALDKLSHVWVRLFLKKLKIVILNDKLCQLCSWASVIYFIKINNSYMEKFWKLINTFSITLKSIFDLLSYSQFSSNFFSKFWKNTR